ncbi:MAG: hypothetical protein V2A58_10305, partial [Planctomycetota bacterium]
MRKVVGACLAAVLLGWAGWASAEEAGELATKLARAALFKNGLGLLVREGEMPAKAGVYRVTPLPVPAHGTFWVTYPAEAKVEGLSAVMREASREIEAVTIKEMLAANVGREVTLSTDLERRFSGKVLAVAPDRVRAEDDPYRGGRGVVDEPRGMPQGEWVLLDEGKDVVTAVPLREIKAVDFLGGPPARTRAVAGKEAALEMRVAGGAGALEVSYLAKGVSWAPSYLIDVTDAKNAAISAQALIINEVEDFEGVEVELVTGFPNLKFADVVSPIALKENLAGFLNSLTQGRTEGRRRGSVVTQNVAMYEGMGMSRVSMPEYGAGEAPAVHEDLFYYPVKDLSLAKGGVAYVGLFTKKVPYEHIYQWQIGDFVNEQDMYRQREEREEPEEVVWHSLRLENATEIPWTTAPAQTMSEGAILGQDVLGFTPASAKTTVKITQTTSVKPEQVEYEVERERDAVQH